MSRSKEKKKKIAKKKNQNQVQSLRPQRSCTVRNVDPRLKVGEKAVVVVDSCGFDNKRGPILVVVVAVPNGANRKYQLEAQDRQGGRGGKKLLTRDPTRPILSLEKPATDGDHLQGALDILGAEIDVVGHLESNLYQLTTHEPNVKSEEYLKFANRNSYTYEEISALITHGPFLLELSKSGSAFVPMGAVHPHTQRVARLTCADGKGLIAVANLDMNNTLVGVCQAFINEMDKLNPLANRRGSDISLERLLSFDWSQGSEGDFTSCIFMICKKGVDSVPKSADEIDAICVCITQDWGVIVVAFGVRKKMRSEGLGTYLVMQLPFLLRDYLGNRRGPSYAMPIIYITRTGSGHCGIGLYFQRRYCLDASAESYSKIPEITDLLRLMTGNGKRDVAVRYCFIFCSDAIRPHPKDANAVSYRTRSLGVGSPLTATIDTTGPNSSDANSEEAVHETEVMRGDGTNGSGGGVRDETNGGGGSGVRDGTNGDGVRDETNGGGGVRDETIGGGGGGGVGDGTIGGGGGGGVGDGTIGGGGGGGVGDGTIGGGGGGGGGVGDGTNGGGRVGESPRAPKSDSLKRGQECITRSDKEDTIRTPITDDGTAFILTNGKNKCAAIVIGKHGQCQLTFEKGALLTVQLGVVLISADSKACRYSASADNIRVKGRISIENTGDDDAIVVADSEYRVPLDRKIICMPYTVNEDDGKLRREEDYYITIVEYEGTYNVNSKIYDNQVEFDTKEICAKMLTSLMKRTARIFDRNYDQPLDQWMFHLMKGRRITFSIDTGVDPTPDAITEILDILQNATVREEPVLFYDPTDVRNELVE